MICDAIEEVRDLYVLGALATDEEDEVEEHISECRACAALVAESWQAAQLLRRAVAMRDPDPNTLATLQETLTHEQQENDEAKIKVLPPRPRRRIHIPRESVRWAAAMAVVPLLATVWIGSQLVILQNHVAATERTLEQTWQNGMRAADVMGKAIEHGGRMAALVGTQEAPTAAGTFYYMPGDREGVLIVSGLPKLHAGDVYQLWLLAGAESLNGGTFHSESDGSGLMVVKAPIPLVSVQGLRITSETHGGNASPAGKRYLWANLERPRPS